MGEPAGGDPALDQFLELLAVDLLAGDVAEVVGVEEDDLPALADPSPLGQDSLPFPATPDFPLMGPIAQSQPEADPSYKHQELDQGCVPCAAGVTRGTVRL